MSRVDRTGDTGTLSELRRNEAAQWNLALRRQLVEAVVNFKYL